MTGEPQNLMPGRSSLLPRRAGRRYSLAIVVTLALGIAGATTVFAVLDRAREVYRLFPGEEGVQWMAEDRRLGFRIPPTTEDFANWQGTLDCCEALTPVVVTDGTLWRADGARSVRLAEVGPAFLQLVDRGLESGRGFETENLADNAGTVLLRQGLAHHEFGEAREALGEKVTLDGRPRTVIGVFSDDLATAISPGERLDALLPIDLTQHERVQVLGRLRKGVTRDQARAELVTWASTRPAMTAGEGELGWVLLAAAEQMDTRTLRLLQVATLGGLLLILVTGANVTHLLAARDEVERRQYATCWALGASRWHLLRGQLSQALGQTLVAGLAAALLANFALTLATHRPLPENLRFLVGVRVGAAAVLFALALSFLTMLIFGTLPTIARRPPRLMEDLKADPRFGRPPLWSRAFGPFHIGTMVGASTVLAVAAWLVGGTVLRLGQVDLGFEMDRLTAIEVRLPTWKYEHPASREAFFAVLVERLSGVPGVTSLALTTQAPPRSGVFFGSFGLPEHTRVGGAKSPIGLVWVGPGYFRTLRQRLVAGRELTPDDLRADAPVLVLSEAAAKSLGREPAALLGERVQFGDELREVVGVVVDLDTPGPLATAAPFQVYLPLIRYRPTLTLMARTRDDRTPDFRQITAELDPDVVVEARPIQAILREGIGEVRFLMVFLLCLTALALGLAIAGAYAVLSHFVERQRAQVGLRMALGASREQIRAWLLRRGLSQALAGVAVGWLVSYPASGLLADHLFRVEAWSTFARLAPTACLLGAIALAILLPAFRASRTEPDVILRRS